MFEEIIVLILITLLPFFELRVSIPYGIVILQMNWILVFFVCVMTNIILGPIIYIFIDKIMHVFLRIRFLDRLYSYYIERTQKRIHKYVQKYGELGIVVFIGIPFPGSGSYSGALASYLIGMKFKKFVIANAIGVLIAGLIIFLVSLTMNGLI